MVLVLVVVLPRLLDEQTYNQSKKERIDDKSENNLFPDYLAAFKRPNLLLLTQIRAKKGRGGGWRAGR